MQGLILADLNDWPDYVDKKLRELHRRTKARAEENKLSMIDVALGFIQSQKIADEILVGITSQQELSEITSTYQRRKKLDAFDLIEDLKITASAVDPRYWKKE